MRKLLIYILGFLVLFFVAPVICTITPKRENVQETATKFTENENDIANEDIQNTTEEKYDYQKYKTIKLLHLENNQVEELNIDEYLYGVVSSEMPASFELEALKAQAVVARTYTIYQIIHNFNKHENADICDDFNCCQAWISKDERLAKWNQEEAESNWNKIVEAVDLTQGKIVTYNKEKCTN